MIKTKTQENIIQHFLCRFKETRIDELMMLYELKKYLYKPILDILTMLMDCKKDNRYFTNDEFGEHKVYANSIIVSDKDIEDDLEIMINTLKKEIFDDLVKKASLTDSLEKKQEILREANTVIPSRAVNKLMSSKNFASNFLKTLDEQSEKKKVKTKNYIKFNKNVKFTSGNVVIIGARPAMCKSSFSMNLALELCKNGSKGIFFSLEMTEEDMLSRFVSMISGVSLAELQDRERYLKLNDNDIARVNQAFDIFNSLNLYLSIGAGITPDRIKKEIEDIGDIDFIIVDYLQIMRTDTRTLSRENEISTISRELKEIAMEYKIPVIAVSQLSRELERRLDKRPILADLRESGSLEQDASVVIMLYREIVYNEKYQDPYELEVIVRKNRQGKTGVIKFDFIGHNQKITEKV